MIFKCKMCGGALDVAAGASIAECPYCGAKQTLPKLDDEKRANLYDRAGHFRRMSDFDKAMALYEEILREDGTDAEAYWSIVLCRYGIEYVEDPATHRRIPTVNRAQLTSILADEDYKAALTYADGHQRELYEAEAKEIENIQKGILAISEREAPFDVFICYKETDERGVRTRDSVLANDLYYELTNEGYKVFFSRITLEDKLGTAYEPYIFAALRSAPVMVVVGTKPEYLNAPWVKNEWSRYLALIRGGAKKTLIPAYRDMDPYDLPDAFSHLQAQDMSKLGFMQDLLRGIKKLVAANKPEATAAAAAAPVTAAPAGGSVQYLKRARIFLEDGNWQSADEYVEHALDNDPEDGEAYLLKLLVGLHLRSESALGAYGASVAGDPNYVKALRYSKGKRHEEIASYETQIQENIRSRTYQKAQDLYSARNYAEARSLFLGLGNYRDAKEQAGACVEAIRYAQNEKTVGDLRAAYGRRQNDEGWLAATVKVLGGMTDFAPAAELREKMQARIDDLQEMRRIRQEQERRWREEAALQAKREAELQRIRREKRRERTKRFLKWAIPTMSVICVLLLLTFNWWIPAGKYRHAEKLLGEGKYTTAAEVLGDLKPGYRHRDTRLYAAATLREINRQKGKNIVKNIGDLLSAGVPVKVTYETAGGTLQSGEQVRLVALSDENHSFGTVGAGEDAVCFYQKSADFTRLETVAREGYEFLSWNYVSSSMEFSDEGDCVAVTLRAVWTTKAYTLTFDLGGGTIKQKLPAQYGAESENITIGQPIRRGYTFVGWTGTGLTEPVKDLCIPTGSWGDRSYTVVWQVNTYTLTLDANGGTCEANAVTVTYGSVPKLPTPIRTGHTFSGWYCGTKEYGKSAYMETEDLKLTAAWDLVWYPVTYHLNGGKNAANNVSTYNVRTGLFLSEPTRKGYTFIGWTYAGHDTPERNVSLPAGTIGAQEFTAVWQVTITYTLRLNANGGTCEANTVEAEYGTRPTISVPIRDGFTFGGWYTDINLANAWGGTVFSDLTLHAYWSEETKPCDLGYETYGNGYRITKYTGSSAILWLPVYIGGRPVVAIADKAFENKTLLTKVVIPDSVTSIGNSAFYGCSSLTSITIPDSVTSIGGSAFSDCTGLTSITIPNSVTSIGGYAFYHCTGLTSITIPNSVTSIGEYAFSNTGYYNRDSNWQDGVLYIGKHLIEAKDTLSGSYQINSGTLTIADNAFSYCTGLTSIAIPDGVTSIGEWAFSGCTGLTSITIPNSVTSIGSSAFSGCTGLTSITIPNSVTSIGSSAFSGCTGLTSITVNTDNTKYHSNGNCLIETERKTLILGCKNSVIPSDGTVTSIGYSAFSDCTGLTSITIPDSVTSIGNGAFHGCTGLTSVTIGNGVTSIGYSAFSYCTGLTSIIIPDSVTSILSEAFSGCTGLTSIQVSAGNTKYHSQGNCLIETGSKTLVLGCKNSVIPSDGTVTSVGYEAFYHCTGLTSITIPNSVTSIGYYAFSDCTSLTSITIPNSVTSIGGYAFSGCSKLTSVTIGNGVTSIGYSAFSYCTGLTSITIPNSVTSIGSGAFYGCTSLTTIRYGGTVAQWKTITKDQTWANRTGNFTVYCSDGTITKGNA